MEYILKIINSKILIIVWLSLLGSLTFAQDRRVNFTGQRVYLEKKGDIIYFGADEQSDHDDGVSWMRASRIEYNEIDAQTFRQLTNFCGIDKSHAFYRYNGTFITLTGIDINSFKILRNNCSYALVDSGVIMDLVDTTSDGTYQKEGDPMYQIGRTYQYKLLSIQNSDVYRVGKDEQYFYFINDDNKTYTYDGMYKLKYDKVKKLFEQKIRKKFEELKIKGVLIDIENQAQKDKKLFIQSMAQALLDDYRPYDWN